MFEDILFDIKDGAGAFSSNNAGALNPLVLAYIGDAVYEVFIRTVLISMHTDYSVHRLHINSTSFVKAHAQSEIVKKILPLLSDEEVNIVKRGRNSKSGFVPKNADVIEYRLATGFEALIGYLYLKGNSKRLVEVLKLSISEGQSGINNE